MNSRYYKEQETQDLLTELDVLFNSLDKGETAFDNLAPSIGFNLSLFFCVDALWLMGPALALALIYVPLHWWIERRYRDSWEAHLTRERDRIDRIGRILNLIDLNRLDSNDPHTQNLLNHLKNLIDHYNKDTKDLCERLANEKYVNILSIQNNKRAKDRVDGEDEEKEVAIVQEQNLLLQLLEKERYGKYLALTQSFPKMDNTISPKAETKNAELTELEKKLDTLSIGPKGRSFNFDIRFMGGYAFNVLLSYSLAYWLIYYYSTAAVAGALLTTPIGWALLALTFPVIYLVYKEFTTYRARLVETEAETKEKTDSDQLHFRRGWIFVALILGITLVVGLPALGLSIVATIAIAAASCMGVISISAFAAVFIDERVEEEKKKAAIEKTETVEATAKADQSFWTRKAHADRRRQELDHIALIAVQLANQNKLADQANQYAGLTNRICNTNLRINAVIKPQQIVQKATTHSNTDRKITFTEKLSLVLNVVLSGAMGYALGGLIGFVLNDFLSHISAVFLGPLSYVISGVISLAVGCFFSRRAYYSEKIHQTKLSAVYADGDVTQKQAQIDALDGEIIKARKTLEELEKNKQHAIAAFEKNGVNSSIINALNSLKQLKPDLQFAHPVKNERVTKRKVFFAIRTGLRILISVTTASLLVRALLLGGFAKFIPGVVGSSLMLFGASAGPLGFVILGLVIAVFLVKTAHDIYLDYRRHQEMVKIESADFTIQCKQAEIGYLQGQIDIMTPMFEAVKSKASEIENRASHSVLSDTKTALSSNEKELGFPEETLQHDKNL